MYYPAWLPVLAWSAGLLGVVLALGLRLPAGSPVRRKLELGSVLCFAAALLLGGTVGLLFNRRAPHIAISGVLYDVRPAPGSGKLLKVFSRPEPLDDFFLTENDPNIEDGQLSRIVYQAGTHRLLSVEVLYGEHAGYGVRQADGTMGAVCCFVAAGLLLALGWLRWVRTAAVVNATTEPHTEPSSLPASLEPEPLKSATQA